VTVTGKDAFAPLPRESTAVQDTTVVPTGNLDPDAGVHTGVTAPSTASTAETLKLTSAPDGSELVV
jgi:hypothetical protein